MSGFNGDKARFNIARKRKIRRRIRQQAVLGPSLKSAGAGLSEPKTGTKGKQV